MKRILFLFILLVPYLLSAQDDKPKIEKTIYGFVKNDMFWDSRQTVTAREGHFLLYPSAVKLDANGVDINSVPNFNFLAVQSRVGIKVTGAEALNAKLTAVVEGDFFGQANDNINLFRLRHAYLKMNWNSTELLFGQTWVPMFITDCFPGTISFNTGVPFQPFGRAPQVRLTQKIGFLKLIAVANAQRDYASRYTGVTSTYLRNSSVPELSAQAHLDFKNDNNTSQFIIGGGAGYKSIVPQIETSAGLATDEAVSGYSAIGFLKVVVSGITLKAEAIYGQNIPDVLSIGGFGVTSVDSVTGYTTYATLNTLSMWGELSANINNFEIGVFAGYSENKGANETITNELYGLGYNIESLYRISPRVSYKFEKLKFALEAEYTSANYGDGTYSSFGIPLNTVTADNMRILFSAYYFF